MPKKTDSNLVTLAVAAERKGVSHSTVRRWVAKRLVRRVVIGPRMYLVDLAEVMRYEPPPRGRRWPKKE